MFIIIIYILILPSLLKNMVNEYLYLKYLYNAIMQAK